MTDAPLPGYGVASPNSIRHLSGLEFMTAIMDGRLPRPPIAQTLGFALTKVEKGLAVFTGEPRWDYLNPIGTIHGGYIATLLDSCMGCAVHTTIEPGFAYTTLEIKVNYVRAVLAGTGKVMAEGRVIHAGRRAATAEGRLVDSAGKLYAHATTTCIIMPA